jgi:hypothetical protein
MIPRPALPELERAFGAYVAGGRLPAPALEGAVSDPARLSIYHNHFLITLSEALGATYPVVRRLVGERFFAQTVRAFLQHSPPRSPCLFEYGEGFAAHLAQDDRTRALPYLPDVARLEWALNACDHAAEAEPLSAEALARLDLDETGRLELALHPACRLIESDFPVDRIWLAHWQDPVPPIPLEEGCVRLLIRRDGEGTVGFTRLVPGDFALLKALNRSAALEAAVGLALKAELGFEAAQRFARLLKLGLFVAAADAPGR